MDKPTVRAGFTWVANAPTPIVPVPESGGCAVIRVGKTPQGTRFAQVDLFVAPGQKASYAPVSGGEAHLVDIPVGVLQPSDNMVRSLPFNIGDPPPPHPPIGPDDLLYWIAGTLVAPA